MKKRSYDKVTTAITIIIYLISLIPVFILARYNYPSADDYYYGAYTYQAWNEHHSITAVLQAAMQTIKELYYTWQGTFSGIFLMTLQPGIFGSQWYFLVPFIIISSLTASYLFLLKIILKDYFKASTYHWLTLTFSLLLISIALAYHKAQAFFWYNGTVYYSFIFSLSLFLIGCLLKYPLAKSNRSKFILLFFIILLSFFIGGGNFATALFTPVLITVSALCFRLSGKKIPVPIFVSVICILAGLFISALAPGNSVRQDMQTHTPSIILSILKTVGSCGKDLIRWQNPAVILIFIFLSPILYKIAKNSPFKFKYPLLISIISFGVYCSFYVPTYYAVGYKGPFRMLTVGKYIFYWFLLFNLFYYIGHIIRKREAGIYNFSLICKYITRVNTHLQKYPVCKCLLIFFVLFSPLMFSDSTFRMAISELKSGEAAQYAKEMKAREKFYLSDEKNIVVEELTVKPEMLYHLDITTNKNYWCNINVSRYFQKESVRTKDKQ